MAAKHEQVAAFLPDGKNLQWGKSPIDFKKFRPRPYLTASHKKQLNTTKDNAVNGEAYEGGDVVTGFDLSNSLEVNLRFDGFELFFAWAMGFQHAAKEVEVFEVDNATASPAKDGIDWQSGGNTYNFLRKEEVSLPSHNSDPIKVTYFVFSVKGTRNNLLEGTSGQLTSGASSIAFSRSNDDYLFEHIFEMPKNRRLREFTAAEKAVLKTQWLAGDMRNLQMSMVKNMGDYDICNFNNVCEKFGFKYSPANFVTFSADMFAYGQKRVSEARTTNYDMDCDFIETDSLVNHYQSQVEISEVGSDYISGQYSEGVTDVSVEVSTPLQKIQTMESKQHFDEPWLEGKYQLSGSITLGRHRDERFQDWRDSRTPLKARIASYWGFEMQEVLLKKFTLKGAGAGDEDVPSEALDLGIEMTCNKHNFGSWLDDEDVYKKAPLVFRVRCRSDINWLTLRDSTGTEV